MLNKSIENIIKRVEDRELTAKEAKELISLEMKFEMRRSNAKRSGTNFFF
ncbi:MAG: hypothetical protein R6V47_02590 [Candidatus Delongbacteria bacterium]